MHASSASTVTKVSHGDRHSTLDLRATRATTTTPRRLITERDAMIVGALRGMRCHRNNGTQQQRSRDDHAPRRPALRPPGGNNARSRRTPCVRAQGSTTTGKGRHPHERGSNDDTKDTATRACRTPTPQSPDGNDARPPRKLNRPTNGGPTTPTLAHRNHATNRRPLHKEDDNETNDHRQRPTERPTGTKSRAAREGARHAKAAAATTESQPNERGIDA